MARYVISHGQHPRTENPGQTVGPKSPQTEYNVMYDKIIHQISSLSNVLQLVPDWTGGLEVGVFSDRMVNEQSDPRKMMDGRTGERTDVWLVEGGGEQCSANRRTSWMVGVWVGGRIGEWIDGLVGERAGWTDTPQRTPRQILLVFARAVAPGQNPFLENWWASW